MALNTIAGRSYNDLAQYFVFPWIIADYGGATAVPGELRSALGMEPAAAPREPGARAPRPARESEDRVADADPPSDDDDDVRLDANDSDDDDDGGEPAPRAPRRRDRRPRARPVGALEPERLRAFVERYRSSDAMGADGDAARFMYGSHYSSAGVVLHFLVRLEPFTSLALELQGGHFDCPDRLFFDVAESWRGCTASMSGVKELVPEFFYCPELFVNDNRYPLGELQDGRAVDDVLLPAWAADARAFVRGNAAALESEAVSAALPRWIDLVFGVGAKRGTHAETHHNVFHPLTYEGGVDLTQIADATLREAAEAQITHFGQTPPSLFDAPHPPRSLKGQPEVGALFDDDRGSLAVHRGYGERVGGASAGAAGGGGRGRGARPERPADALTRVELDDLADVDLDSDDGAPEPPPPRTSRNARLPWGAPAVSRAARPAAAPPPPSPPRSPPPPPKPAPAPVYRSGAMGAVVAVMASGKNRVVAAFYFKPAPDGYGRPFSLRLEFRKQLPSFPLSRAWLRVDAAPVGDGAAPERDCFKRAARAARAAGRAWHGRAQYCLCLATPGNLSGLSLTAEPSPQQAS
ncbi:hypothetical protein JL722_6849 [Aureococcus anophagefferens]|nr:hypothetical protein JL722_6849 [Aureococcus anophagefferens]